MNDKCTLGSCTSSVILSLYITKMTMNMTLLDFATVVCLLMLFPCHDDCWISENVCLVNEMIFIWGHLVTNQYNKQAFSLELATSMEFTLLLEQVWSCFMSCPLLIKLEGRQSYLKMKLSNRKTCNSLKPYSVSNVIFYHDFFLFQYK